MTFIARKDRPQVWARRAAEAARAQGATSIDVLCATMGAFEGFQCGRYAFNQTKLRVEHIMTRGAASVWVRETYRKYIPLLTPSLTGSIVEIERNYRFEVSHGEDLLRKGLPSRGVAYNVSHLHEMRIALRWLRRFGKAMPFAAVHAALTTTLNYDEDAAAFEGAMAAIGDAMQQAAE